MTCWAGCTRGWFLRSSTPPRLQVQEDPWDLPPSVKNVPASPCNPIQNDAVANIELLKGCPNSGENFAMGQMESAGLLVRALEGCLVDAKKAGKCDEIKREIATLKGRALDPRRQVSWPGPPPKPMFKRVASLPARITPGQDSLSQEGPPGAAAGLMLRALEGCLTDKKKAGERDAMKREIATLQKRADEMRQVSGPPPPPKPTFKRIASLPARFTIGHDDSPSGAAGQILRALEGCLTDKKKAGERDAMKREIATLQKRADEMRQVSGPPPPKPTFKRVASLPARLPPFEAVSPFAPKNQ